MRLKILDIDAFKKELAELDDEAFVGKVERYVWLSGYAANNPRSEYHAKCDATYDEARRREKPWLYQRGWNRAYRAAGHEPSDHDLRLEQPESHNLD